MYKINCVLAVKNARLGKNDYTPYVKKNLDHEMERSKAASCSGHAPLQLSLIDPIF